jgi:hypothetical protein
VATIDIDKLTEAELTDLNHPVVQRLRFLQQMRAHALCSILALASKSPSEQKTVLR